MVRPLNTFVAFLLIWFPFACVVTLIAGLGYAGVQQDLRLTGNDPQIQMAGDTAAALRAGQAAGTLVPSATVDLATSLAPFTMIFDDQGHLVAGSARLQGTPPTLPAGLLDAVRRLGEDRRTWAPAPGVREAAVLIRVDGPQPGFVLAGRSLREVEQRESVVLQLATAGWLLGLASTGVGSAALAWAWGRAQRGGVP